jgi:hypothetical protein
MIYWYLLNYSIFKFYKSRGEAFPDVYSWLAPAGLLNLNLYPLIHIWIEQKGYVDIYGSKLVSIVQLLPFFIITYFTLYYKDRYVKIFEEIDKNREKYEKVLSFVKYYIILSVIIFILFAIFS